MNLPLIEPECRAYHQDSVWWWNESRDKLSILIGFFGWYVWAMFACQVWLNVHSSTCRSDTNVDPCRQVIRSTCTSATGCLGKSWLCMSFCPERRTTRYCVKIQNRDLAYWHVWGSSRFDSKLVVWLNHPTGLCRCSTIGCMGDNFCFSGYNTPQYVSNRRDEFSNRFLACFGIVLLFDGNLHFMPGSHHRPVRCSMLRRWFSL